MLWCCMSSLAGLGGVGIGQQAEGVVAAHEHLPRLRRVQLADHRRHQPAQIVAAAI